MPSIETLLLVADKLGVSVDALVRRDYATPTPSERYLLDFLDKLTIRTDEDDSIEWKRTPLAVLESIDCDRDGYVDHPLFFADYGPLPDGEDGYRIHYSSHFRKAEPMKPCGDGFVLDIGRGSELYLMKVVLVDDASDPDLDFEYELYIRTRSEMKGLCHTNARTVTPGLFDSLLQHLYSSAAESSSHVRLGDDIKGILDSFLAGDTEEYVQGRANRKYVNEQAVAEKVIADGKNPYEQKLLGITAMEKLLGKKHFAELLAGLVERPQGKPVLVTEDDKRPEINTAQNDFNE